MGIYYINGNIMTQTAAEWALDSTVYSNKTILVTSDLFYTGTDQPRFKFANGTDIWSNLDYVPEGGGGTNGMIMTFWNSIRFSPSDNVPYYFTQWTNPSVESTEFTSKSYAPVDFTIKSCSISIVCGAGSDEDVDFQIGINGTYTTILSTPLNNVDNKFLVTGLSIPVSQGDDINVRFVSPVWATNPTNLRGNFNLYVEQ